MEMKFISKRVFWYYFFLIAGGLWNLLGYFQDIMSLTSGYVMILLGIICFLESKPNSWLKLTILGIFIIITSIFFEYIGTNYSLLFGNYSYSDMLQPQIKGIPLAIGFSWLSVVLFGSKLSLKYNSFIYVLTGSMVLTAFDYLLEPAAINLGYWRWSDIKPPFFNYLTWFGIGAFYLTIKRSIKLSINGFNLIHLFIAQILFFILSSI